MDIRVSALIEGGDYTCTPKWTSSGLQYTDCHRLYFTRKGRADFSLPEHKWKLEEGYIYLLPGYQWIRYGCPRHLTLDWMHFRPESMDMELLLSRFKSGVRWPAREWSEWKSVYTGMAELFARRPPELVCRTQAMLLWLFSELLRKPQHRAEAAHAEVSALQSYNQLKTAIDYMDRNYLANPALDDVAASVHLSPIYFHRCFTQSFHITPHAYLQRKRMHYAWELLRSGEATVSQTAEQLNFSTPFYFSRAFKRFFGTAPVDVRMGRAGSRP
jgi:AraC-like DNA-binding protein